ncbi:exo-alpha-sialidase [bacterium]|nr:exo-alpha-sialidase [bacterium]
MKIRTLILLSLILLWTGCEKVRNWPWETRTITLHEGYTDLQTPGIVHTREGEWLVVFSAKTDTPNTEGLILLIRSDHLQGVWSKPDTIARTSNFCRNPKIAQMKSGMLWVQFEIGHISRDHHWNELGNAYVQSYDYGQRFSIPRLIRVPESQSWESIQTLIESETGQWILPVLEIDSLEQKSPGFITSDDEGKTWSSIKRIFTAESGENIHDFSLVMLSDQTRLVLMEIEGEDQIYQIYSKDRGRNWTCPVPINIYGNRPCAVQSKSGAVYCWYRDQWPPGTSIMRSFDFGRTFEQKKRLDLPEKSSFPVIVEYKNEQMLMLYTNSRGIYARIYLSDKISAPSGLSASADSSSVTLRWNPVEQAGYYRIFRGLNHDSLNSEIPFYDICTKTCYRDSMVQSDMIYTYQVTAIQGIGKLFSGTGSESIPGESCEIHVP